MLWSAVTEGDLCEAIASPKSRNNQLFSSSTHTHTAGLQYLIPCVSCAADPKSPVSPSIVSPPLHSAGG